MLLGVIPRTLTDLFLDAHDATRKRMAPHFTQLVLVYAQQIRKLTYVALTAQFQTEIDAVAAEWRASGALNGAHRARRVTGALRSIRFIFTYFSIFTLLRMTPPTTMGSSAPSSARVRRPAPKRTAPKFGGCPQNPTEKRPSEKRINIEKK